MFNDLSRMGKYLGQAARMLVGMPDYDTYVEHMRNKHHDLRGVLPRAPGGALRWRQGSADPLLLNPHPSAGHV